MTTNKIPTDEQILREWWEGNENVEGSNPFPEGTDWRKDDYLHLMAQSRAAGRAEGLEEAAKIAENLSVKSLPNALLGSVIGKDAILAANVIAEEIRYQAEGTKEGEQ